jgi:CubicO group peptidase (beta-lactamase class C family)
MINDPELDKEDIFVLFKDRVSIFPPAATFAYSGPGYFLLGHIIERVTGKPYEQVINERVFHPLGMRNSGYGTGDFSEPDVAFGYSMDSGQMDFLNHDVVFAGGALVSSARDLLLWNKSLFGGDVLEPSSYEQMFTPFQLEYGSGRPGLYGYGWYITDTYWHPGTLPGFSALDSYDADEGLLIVILSNHGNETDFESLYNDLNRVVSDKQD